MNKNLLYMSRIRILLSNFILFIYFSFSRKLFCSINFNVNTNVTTTTSYSEAFPPWFPTEQHSHSCPQIITTVKNFQSCKNCTVFYSPIAILKLRLIITVNFWLTHAFVIQKIFLKIIQKIHSVANPYNPTHILHIKPVYSV